MGAGNERVQTFDFVDKSMLYQKVERPIGDGRLRAKAFCAQDIQYVVGTHRTVFRQQDFKNPPARWCQLQLGLAAKSIDRFHAVGNADRMVMGREPECAQGLFFPVFQLQC